MKNNCPNKANGKLHTKVCKKLGIKYKKNFPIVKPVSWKISPGNIPLYSIVAKKLIQGHIIQTVAHITAVSTIIGLYSRGGIAFIANFNDKGLPIKISDK